MLPPGTGAPTGFEHRAAKSSPAMADPSLPASLGLALFLGSCPSWLPCFPCAACSSQGLSKGHRCGSALSKRLVLRVAASSMFPGRRVYVLPDESCAERRSLRATPAADCQQVSECPHMSPACKHCSKRSPREFRLGMSLARCSWEAGSLLLRTDIYPGRPHRGYLNPIRKSDLCDLHQVTMLWDFGGLGFCTALPNYRSGSEGLLVLLVGTALSGPTLADCHHVRTCP